jgi:hypothetical protein
MLNNIAYFMAEDVMRQQFQTAPLHTEPEAPRLRWRLSVKAWTQPMATALRAAAERLETLEQPGYACELEAGM